MNRAGRVATKTLLRLLTSDRASQRVIKRRRHGRLMSDREIQFPKFFEITDARLVEDVVVSEEVGLADVALAKTIKDRLGNAISAVANSVDDRLALPRKLVRVRSVLERQLSAGRD